MEVLAWIIGLLIFIVVLALSVGLHEAGHMSVAKLFKLDVPSYFIGFGPKVWSKKTSKTEYGVRAIPLGGYVLIQDEKFPEKSEERMLLSRIHPMKRILVYFAGPAVNIVLGAFILMSVLLIYPVAYVSSNIETVNQCSTTETVNCNALNAGLKDGDKIIAVDGVTVSTIEDLASAIQGKDVVEITVLRQGSEMSYSVPVSDDKIGVDLQILEKNLTFAQASSKLGELFVLNAESLAEMPSKLPGVVQNILGSDRDPEAPSSIVAAGKTYGDTSASTTITQEDKIYNLLLYSGLLNIGLGFVNLLPLMPLDGARIVFAIIDWFNMGFSKLFRREYNPLGLKALTYTTAVTGSMVFAFMGLLMVSDILNIIRGQM